MYLYLKERVGPPRFMIALSFARTSIQEMNDLVVVATGDAVNDLEALIKMALKLSSSSFVETLRKKNAGVVN